MCQSQQTVCSFLIICASALQSVLSVGVLSRTGTWRVTLGIKIPCIVRRIFFSSDIAAISRTATGGKVLG